MSQHEESAILLDFDKLYLHTNGMDDKYRIFIPNFIELAPVKTETSYYSKSTIQLASVIIS